jgi:Sensors of blue-light using FAD
MLRLVYVSTCAPGLALDDVYDIMRQSHPWNVNQGISGMLCWSGEFFLQCLEGERNAVSRTFAKICSDPRHANVEILIAAPTRTRWFGEWGMGFSRLLASHRLDLAAGRAESFNPYLLEAVDLESVFEQLSQVAQRLSIE